jgi:hypothetical protein
MVGRGLPPVVVEAAIAGGGGGVLADAIAADGAPRIGAGA